MAIAYVNSNSGYSGGPITLTGVTAGNLLVAFVCGAGSMATTTLPSGWVKCTARLVGSVGACHWYYPNHPGGDVSATITNAPSDPGWSIHEYSGADTSDPLQGEGVFTSESGGNWDTTDVATDVADAVLFVSMNDESASMAYSPTGTWNSRTTESGHYHRTIDRIVTSTGTYDSQGTVSGGSETYIVALSVFQGPASGASSTPIFRRRLNILLRLCFSSFSTLFWRLLR